MRQVAGSRLAKVPCARNPAAAFMIAAALLLVQLIAPAEAQAKSVSAASEIAQLVPVRDPEKPTPRPRPSSGPGSGCKMGVAQGNLCVGVRPIPTIRGPLAKPFAIPREPGSSSQSEGNSSFRFPRR